MTAEEELSRHLNDASKEKRKEVESDPFYLLSIKANDFKAALQRAYDIINGAADSRAQARRIRKKKQKREAFLKEINEYL